tara:strand:- start:7614 stop:7994 length:381 start_codon:yes stop_codon:yes gene_type:complete
MKDILLHTRKLQAAVKDFSLEELNLAAQKLAAIIEKRNTKAQKDQEAKKDKLNKIEEIKQQLKESGLSINDLDAVVAKRRKNTPRPPKYSIKDSDGELITWTGQGRMPNVFKFQLEKGKQLDDFLI